MLTELDSFREFLGRTATDRLNRENEPGKTPRTLELYSAYAVALRVEHTWGEELVDNLASLLQFDAAYHRESGVASIAEPVGLKLNDRK